jgi:hypothetical protein
MLSIPNFNRLSLMWVLPEYISWTVQTLPKYFKTVSVVGKATSSLNNRHKRKASGAVLLNIKLSGNELLTTYNLKLVTGTKPTDDLFMPTTLGKSWCIQSGNPPYALSSHTREMCSAIHREQYATLSETRDTISCALIYTLH